jgi:hypothetical protein
MTKISKASAAAMLALTALASSAFAAPGFIALEGSDATSFHQDSQYGPQLFKYLQGGSAKSVLVYNASGTTNIDGSTGHINTYVTSLSGVTLSDYSALYIQTPFTCCQADNTVLDGYGAAVNAFIAAGGNLAIGNWIGGTYDGVVPGGNAPVGMIQGVGTGMGAVCTDGELVTANGLAKGFTQPPIDGCWEHQGYSNSYFSSFGYISLMASDPIGYVYPDGTSDGSAFLAIGGTLGTVPEPASWALMIAGFGLIGVSMRRKVATASLG